MSTHTTPASRLLRLRDRLVIALSSDRGDVPGWVLITMMTAGLVVAIWAIAAPALGTVFDQAITRVVAF